MKRRTLLPLALSLTLGCFPVAVFSQGEPVTGQGGSDFSVTSGSTAVLDASSLQNATSLTVASGGTAVIDFGASPVINFSGDVVNAGSIFAISTNPFVSTASINALNINNGQGGLISTGMLPSSITGISQAVSSMSLSLTAVNQIVNQGTISSSGSLTMAAGAALVNEGTITAAQNVAISSLVGNIVNSGVISSASGNINLSAIAGSNLLVNNLGGYMEALLGSIAASTAPSLESLSLQLLGGDFVASSIDLTNLNGYVDVNTGKLEGVVNVTSCGTHITASTPDLVLGTMNVTGDPTFYNTGGDLTISQNLNFAPINFTTGPVALAFVAQGNINAGASVNEINVSTIPNSLGSGAPYPGNVAAGSIMIVAGAQFSVSGTDGSPVSTSPPPAFPGNPALPAGDTSNTLTIASGSAGGGNINLSGVALSTQAGFATAASAQSGDVILAAYGGATNPGNISVGAITTGEYNPPANDAFGKNGSVVIVGEGNITTGTINTSGNAVNTSLASGNILIASAKIMELQLPTLQNTWTPTLTTLAAPTVFGGFTNTAGSPGYNQLTVAAGGTPPAASTTVYLDPHGPAAESVVVSSVNGQVMTLQSPLKNYHTAGETLYVANSGGVVINAGAGVVSSVPITQNGATFAPDYTQIQNGTITIGGQITGNGAVTIVTGGAVNVNAGIGLTMNPTLQTPTSQNYNRLPVISIRGDQGVTVASGVKVSAEVSGCSFCPNTVNVSTTSLTNNGTIGDGMTLSNALVRVTSSGNLALAGSGLFAVPGGSVIEIAAADNNTLNLSGAQQYQTGDSSLVIFNAQGPNGVINLSANQTLIGPVVSINTPALNASGNVFLGVAAGRMPQTFALGSGYTGENMTITANGSLNFLGAPVSIRPYDGKNLTLSGSGSINFSQPAVLAVSGGGSINATVSMTGTVYQLNNPSGGLHGIAFQPYVGGRISPGTAATPYFPPADFAAYPYQTVLALLGQILAPVNLATGVAAQEFQLVSTYTQGFSSGYVIEAAKQVGLKVSAGAFVLINSDGTVTQSAYNTAAYDVQMAVAGAALHGNVYDIIVGNENIVGGANPAPSISTLQTFINGGNVTIQFVGNQAVTGAKAQRDAAINPLTGTNFTSTTLPITTRQQNGVLNLVTNAASGMVGLMNSLEGYVYGNYYPFFNQDTVIPALLANPNISRTDFTNLVAGTSGYMSTQFDLNANNFLNNGVTIDIRVGETGWATPMDQQSTDPLTGYFGTSLPQQNVTWAQWYFQDMQNWSLDHVNPITNTAGVTIGGYFESYNEPWKGIVGGNPNGTAISLTANASMGDTSVTLSNVPVLYTPTLTPMSIVINPGTTTQEVQNYYMPQPGGSVLPVGTTNFPATIKFNHLSGEPIVAGSPQEPFFGLFKAYGITPGNPPGVTPLGTPYTLKGVVQLVSVTPRQGQAPPPTAPAPSPAPGTSPGTIAPVTPFNSLLAAFLSPSLSGALSGSSPLSGALLASSFLGTGGLRSDSTILQTDVNPERLPEQFNSTQSAPGDVFGTPAMMGLNNSSLMPHNPDTSNFLLSSGSAFLLPDHNMTVETPSGKVNIAADSAVMIFHSDSGLSVFNIFDNKTGNVSVSVGDDTYELPVGRQFMLTSKQHGHFDEIDQSRIGYRNLAGSKLAGKTAYTSEFSLPSALHNFAGLKKLRQSDSKEDQRKAERIMKTAAALAILSRGKDSFKRKE